MEKLTVSIDEFCASVGIGRTKAYELVARGEFEVVKIGRRTLLSKRSVVAFIDRSKTN